MKPDTQVQATLKEGVWKNPDRVGGALCFRGTRVPVQTLIDYLDEGRSLDRFLDGFPTVDREQARQFLSLAELADGATDLEGAASGFTA